MTLPKFDRYEALAVLGEGAMGTVYRARDPRLGREVAIKTVRPEFLAQNPNLRARFEREARVVAGLVHPAIVQVYDFGGDFLVMELVRGRELKSLLQEGRRFTPAEAAALLRPLADGLDYAHRAGVIHRDVKPANLFLDAAGRAKIADFGIAKISHEASEGLTAAGEVLGTPKYMSPEQIQSEPLDGRSDQFSLAAVIYELLAGRSPFAADTLSGILYKIVNSPLPPLDPALRVPPGAAAALDRALAKRAAERFPACADFARAFTAGAFESAVPVTPDDLAATLIGIVTASAEAPAMAVAAPVDAAAAATQLDQPPVRGAAQSFLAGLSAAVLPALRATGRALAQAGRATWGFWAAKLRGPHRKRWAGVLLLLIALLVTLLVVLARRPEQKKKEATPSENLKRQWKKLFR